MNTKAIRNYEESYTVSENGTVTSIKKGRVLKQELIKRSNTNYRRVTLCKDGKTTRFQVHQLVAIHFINNPEDKQHINHIDNNGENNLYTNLEWCTHSENMIHAQKQGRLFNSQSKGGIAAGVKSYEKARLKYEEFVDRKFGYIVIKQIESLGKHPRGIIECTKCDKNYSSLLEKITLGKQIMCKKCSASNGAKVLRKKLYQYDDDKNLINTFDSSEKAATYFKKNSRSGFSLAASGKIKKYLGYIWKYEEIKI